MKSILKKDLFSTKSVKETDDEMCEFVDPEGNFIDDKKPDMSSAEIYAPDQTTDQAVMQTRQPEKQYGFLNGAVPSRTQRVKEENTQQVTNINDINANVMNCVNELVTAVNDNHLSNQDKLNVLKYLYKMFQNG